MTKRIEHLVAGGEEKKRCCTCQVFLSLDEFNPCKTTWDGLRPACKKCLQLRRVSRRPHTALYNKEYWQKTKEIQKKRHKKWRDQNVERRRAYNKEWRQKRKSLAQKNMIINKPCPPQNSSPTKGGSTTPNFYSRAGPASLLSL